MKNRVKVLFITQSNLALMGGDTIQIASSASLYCEFADVHVITNTVDNTQISKQGFSPQIKFFSSKSNKINDKIMAAIAQDKIYNYDYIFMRGQDLAESFFSMFPNIYKNKAICYITNEALGIKRNIELLDNAKMVRFQTNEHLEFYLNHGMNQSNYYVEYPSITNNKNYNEQKEYDLIYTGKIAPGWKVDKFFKLAMRYPEKKFCIAYTSMFNNMESGHAAIINYGLKKMKNVDVFHKISREEANSLLAKSRFSYCYRTKLIDNDESKELSTKLLEAASVNSYPILRKTKMHTSILGDDYPFFIDDIREFDFNYPENYDISSKVDSFQQTKIAEQIKGHFVKNDNPVKYITLETEPNISQLLNLKLNSYSVYSENKNALKLATLFKVDIVSKNDIKKDNVIESKTEFIQNYEKFDYCENTVLIPDDKIQQINNQCKNILNYRFIEKSKYDLSVEDLNTLFNTNFTFETTNTNEFLTALNIIGKLEIGELEFGVNTNLDTTKFVTPGIIYNRNASDEIYLELLDYTIKDLVNIAKGKPVKVSEFNLSDTVVVNNIYPSYDNIYAHAFVHARVNAYKQNNVYPTVIVIAEIPNEIETYFYEHQIVIKCNPLGFKNLFMGNANYKFAIHFINKLIYDVLNNYCISNDKVVWFHGSDCLDASKYKFFDQNNPTARKAYERRKYYTDIQDSVLRRICANPTFKSVFVSKWLKDKVLEDYDMPEGTYTVIPNAIDTQTFYFEEKSVKENEKVKFLSIMPFSLENDVYANKLLVDAIELASQEKWFDQCEFSIYGRGSGFKYYTDKLQQVSNGNIHAYEMYLTHDEIKALHSSHHVALFPKNQDTQGVSFYEAMSSGLLSVSSNNSAKPEYCKNGITGLLHKDQDAEDLKEIIKLCCLHFNDLSGVRKAGHVSVVDQFDEQVITKKELNMLKELD